MHLRLVISVIGTDRPGLVETVANLVAEHGGNWLESRMCRLGGEFAGILRLDIAKERHAELETALRELEAQGLTATLRVDSGGIDHVDEERMIAFEMVGPDRPGIVKQMSAALAAKGVNVEEFSSECLSAPMSGERLFNAHVLIQVPDGCDPYELVDIIEQIGEDLGMEIDFEDEEN
jgi:glycine cleavage system regulatory protein